MPLPAVLPDSIGQLQALEELDASDNEIGGGHSHSIVLHLTYFCNTDAEEARVKEALPNCNNLYL